MARPPKQGKKSPEKEEKQPGQPEKKLDLSGKFLSSLAESLRDFSKIDEKKRVELYGNEAFLEQFRNYFKEKNPDALGILDKNELSSYLTVLENKGFSIHTLSKSADQLHGEFVPETPELDVMQDRLSNFHEFCKHKANDNIPAGTFEKFAEEVGFDPQTYAIPSDSKLQTIDDVYTAWKDFADKEHIELTDEQKKHIEMKLCPNYDPVERIMVQIALTKIRRELPSKLRDAFDEKFPMPVTAFSSLKDLRVFKSEWINFLQEHADEIDEKLAKKLDTIMVSNRDIRELLPFSGRDQSKGYEQWQRYFLRVFNKLAMRQLFEEVKDTQEAIEKYTDIIVEGVKGFPPYVNELFKLYPYRDNEIAQVDLALKAQVEEIDKQINQVELSLSNPKTSIEEKNRLRIKRRQLKEQKESLKWKAYLKYLATKDAALAGVMTKLFDARFDFSKLSLADQQIILNVLVKNKLNDLIANKLPDLLGGLDAAELKKFVDDLFDLSKKDLVIPTRDGPVHITFKEKKFLAPEATQLLAVNDLANLKSLPLQFTVQPTPSNQDFFENGVLWGETGANLFHTFEGKTRSVRLNDGYKVSVTKDGKTVTGYLSQYQSMDPEEDIDGEAWTLYSEPVTHITQERKKVTWDNTEDGPAVIIDKNDEEKCDIEVLDRSFYLNGEAIGSMIFAYVLGQQSFNNEITPEKEKELGKKLGKIDQFRDTWENRGKAEQEEAQETEKEDVSSNKEKSEYNKFIEGRKQLSGHGFLDNKENAGFDKGTRLYIKAGESDLPPHNVPSDAWMYLDIVDVNINKGTFRFKIHGGEYGLGKHEGASKEVPLNIQSLDILKDILGTEIYKVPEMKKKPFDEQLGMIKTMFGDDYAQKFALAFNTVKADGSGFEFTQGDFSGQKVAGFGYDVKVPRYDGTRTIEENESVLFEVKRTSDGSYRVSCKQDFVDEKGNKVPKFVRDMDPISFALFIAGKQLQPRSDDQAKEAKKISTKNSDADLGLEKPRQRFSINNITSFFKTSANKIKDNIKKYDDERAEDFTDIMLQKGDLFAKFGKARGGLSTRIGESFEMAGLDYYTTRDARVWKKIEKRQKLFEADKNYPAFLFKYLDALITGKEKPRDIYKIPAVLLAVINKEKHPYSRHFDLIGKGHWVNLILGKGHQQRYFDILNQKTEHMKQNSALFGSEWTNTRNDEIIKLEIKYIVGVIDGRELSAGAEQDKAQAAKWSQTFAGNLDDAFNKNFNSKSVQEKTAEIDPNQTFEVSEYEYAKQSKSGKPISAFPHLKDMAIKAQTTSQRQQFEMHIVSGILSGWFLNCADTSMKGWIKDICRTRGFLPGLLAKDLNQQSKMLSLINVFLKSSGKKFEDADIKQKFSLDGFSYGNMDNTGAFIADGFKTWRLNQKNGQKFSKFLEFTGKDAAGKNSLLDCLEDPTLSESDKALIREYIGYSNESSQDLDSDVRRNFTAISGTPFTKCESVVRDLMKYDSGVFDGKDSAEKAGPSMFWNEVAKGLPKGRCKTSELKFYLSKFFNRFDSCGFTDGDKRTLFLKRLHTIQLMLNTKDPYKIRQAEDMLWYAVNGTILYANNAGKGVAPKQFESALDAFRKFFKSNLDNILDPNIVGTTMGDRYAKDKNSNEPYSIEGDWAEYVEVMTVKSSFLDTKNKERNKEINKKYSGGRRYAIYKDLWQLAENVDKANKGSNRFRTYYDYDDAKEAMAKTKQSKRAAFEQSGIVVSNPEVTKRAIQETLDPQQPYSPEEEEYYEESFYNNN